MQSHRAELHDLISSPDTGMDVPFLALSINGPQLPLAVPMIVQEQRHLWL